MNEKFVISKQFEFDYGHRIWNQELDIVLSGTSECKCRRLHGHRGKVVVYLIGKETEYIRSTGVVLDFTELKFLKIFIDRFLDHRTLIDISDPFIDVICRNIVFTDCYMNGSHVLCNSIDEINRLLLNSNRYCIVNFQVNDDQVPVYISEWSSSFVICNFIPTAENLAKFFYEYLKEKFLKRSDIDVYKVEFYETPTSCSIYTEL